MDLIDSLNRVYSFHDLSKGQLLLEGLALTSNHQLPRTTTIDTFLKGLLRHYDQVGLLKTDRDPSEDADFAMYLLDVSMSKGNSAEWPTNGTF